VAIEELAARPWLVREEGSGTRTLCLEWLRSRDVEPNLLTLGSNGAIKQAARSGLGVALQSRAAVELELELGRLATISPRGGLPSRRWHVVRSAIGPVREEVEDFMAFCSSAAARQALAQD
jgi:DNA-binding transcriptional LysR family regulator